MRIPKPVAVLAVALVVTAGVTTTAAANTSAADDRLYACQSKTSRYIKMTTATAKCPRGWVKIDWAKDASVGVAGPVGPQGEPGRDGVDGKPGERGLQGPAGPAGQRGPAGPQGPKGEDGKPGADGKDGAPGKDGVDGKPGTDGKDGGVVVLQSLSIKIPGIGTITCYDNKSSDPARPKFNKCDKGSGPSVTPDEKPSVSAPSPSVTASPTASTSSPAN